MSARGFRHVLDRFGLWDEARCTPPRDEFGPLANIGLLLASKWEGEAYRAEIAAMTKGELALFIALCAALGEEFMDAVRLTEDAMGRGWWHRGASMSVIARATPAGGTDE